VASFEKITGVGGVLNTSFNLHGEPIVQTPADADRVFRQSGLDALILDGFLIEKIGQPTAAT
jgi:carbamoyltransferase